MIQNFIGGNWQASTATELLPVHNPATAEVPDRVPLSPAAEVDLQRLHHGRRGFVISTFPPQS